MSPKVTQLIQKAMRRDVDERSRLLEEAYRIFEEAVDKNSLGDRINYHQDKSRFNEDADNTFDAS